MDGEDEEEAVKEPQTTGAEGSRAGAVPSLTAQCCAFLRMKSFEELGKEMAEAGTEPSSAGKMRRRSGGRQKSWVDVMAGRDYLGR